MMSVANRRRGAERRMKEVAVEMERRSGLDRRLIVESATAQIHAALELLTQLADHDALRDDSPRLFGTALPRLRCAMERRGRGALVRRRPATDRPGPASP